MQATRQSTSAETGKPRQAIHKVYENLATGVDTNHYVRGLNDLERFKAAHRALGRLRGEILPFYGYGRRASEQAEDALTLAVQRAVALGVRRDRIYRASADAAIEVLGSLGHNGGRVSLVEDEAHDERIVRKAARTVGNLG